MIVGKSGFSTGLVMAEEPWIIMGIEDLVVRYFMCWNNLLGLCLNAMIALCWRFKLELPLVLQGLVALMKLSFFVE